MHRTLYTDWNDAGCTIIDLSAVSALAVNITYGLVHDIAVKLSLFINNGKLSIAEITITAALY